MSKLALISTWMLFAVLLLGLAGASIFGGRPHIPSDAEILRAASAHYQVPGSGADARGRSPSAR